MLEDHTDILPGFPELGLVHGSKFLSVHKDLSPRRHFQHIDTPDQRGFPGAG